MILLSTDLLLSQPLTGFSSRVWMALLGLGLIPQFLGRLAINNALGHLSAARVSVTLLGQSVITAMLGVVFLEEALSFADLGGGLLVLSGIYFVNQRHHIYGLNAYAKSA